MENKISALEQFDKQFNRLLQQGAKKLDPFVLLLNPNFKVKDDFVKTPYLAAIMGLTHGNEIIGITVLTELMNLFAEKIVCFDLPLIISLNNLEAYANNSRFISFDFNRLYGRIDRSLSNYETSRSIAIQSHLEKVGFALDLHQTQLPLMHKGPFWPALESKEVINAIKFIDPYATIVKTPPKSSNDLKNGVSCDNFMFLNQKIGITAELGTRGFDSYQKSYGLEICLRFLSLVQAKYHEKTIENSFQGQEYHTFKTLLNENGLVLDSKLRTFFHLKKGDIVGRYQDGSLLTAEQDCYALFPKIDSQVQKDSKDPLGYLMA